MIEEYRFYIVNDIDKPCKRHVTQQINKEGVLMYLDKELQSLYKLKLNKRSTSLKDFGFDYEIDMESGIVKFVMSNDSIAEYPDGKTRKWQDKTEFECELYK